MKKLYMSLLACASVLSLTVPMSANPVSPDEALSIALPDSPRRAHGQNYAQKYQLVHTTTVNDVPAAYLFSATDGDSFMLTAADDAAPVLLGYGDGRVSSDSDTWPVQFRDWVNIMSKQVSYISENPDANSQNRIVRPYREPIAPLCTT